jgi:hypothetical protein
VPDVLTGQCRAKSCALLHLHRHLTTPDARVPPVPPPVTLTASNVAPVGYANGAEAMTCVRRSRPKRTVWHVDQFAHAGRLGAFAGGVGVGGGVRVGASACVCVCVWGGGG